MCKFSIGVHSSVHVHKLKPLGTDGVWYGRPNFNQDRFGSGSLPDHPKSKGMTAGVTALVSDRITNTYKHTNPDAIANKSNTVIVSTA